MGGESKSTILSMTDFHMIANRCVFVNVILRIKSRISFLISSNIDITFRYNILHASLFTHYELHLDCPSQLIAATRIYLLLSCHSFALAFTVLPLKFYSRTNCAPQS